MTTAASTTPSGLPAGAEDIVLRAEGITKRYGPVIALRGVDMHLRRGEVLGIVGDNGAGKSTFIKILCGYQRPDEGTIQVEGKPVHFRSVGDSRAMGIETVYQDLALVPQLPIYKNLFLKREITTGGKFGFLSDRKMQRLAREYLDDIKVNIPSVHSPVGQLSGGQRQAIAVARATRSDVKILLLDEPLSAMGAKESALIIDLVKDLSKNRGVSIIVIDHNYAHVFELCDRINVIHGGVVSFDKAIHETSLDELTEYMVSEYRHQLVAGRKAL